MKGPFFLDLQITGLLVVGRLYRSTRENGAIFWRCSVHRAVRFWSAGGTGPKDSDKHVSIIN